MLVFIFLHVDSGTEETVSFTPDTNAESLFSIVKMMTDHGYILSGTDITEEETK